MAPSAVAVQAAVLVAVLAIATTGSHTLLCRASATRPRSSGPLSGPSYEIVRSPVYPNLAAGSTKFRDDPIHGPVVAMQVWYGEDRVFGLRATFLDKYRSPIHGYAKGNTSTVKFDPINNRIFTVMGTIYDNTGPDGSVGSTLTGFLQGTRTESIFKLTPEANLGFDTPGLTRIFGANPELAAVGQGIPGVVLGVSGTLDGTRITQVGYIIEARQLSLREAPTSGGAGSLSWPQKAVVREKAVPRLPTRLLNFDDGVDGKHGEIVEVQIWSSPSAGVRGIRPTFQDGYKSPVRGFATGPSDTLTFDPSSNPLIAVGGRGGSSSDDPEGPAVYRLAALAFFAGGSSPPVRSRSYGRADVFTYSDSPDGKIVGFFGTIGESGVVQLGVHFVSPANGLVGTSGPYPRVSTADAVPFDHTGDNLGVSKIDVYYDNFIGVRGLRFTYVTKLGFKYATPVYGQTQGSHSQVEFDYVNNPLVNVGVYVSNVLAGTGEVGLVGLALNTKNGGFIGTFGVFEFYFNLTDGTKRIVGFHGQANTVVNTLGVYTAPL